MGEYVRSIKVHIEVDTNKQTRVLHDNFDSASDAEDAVAQFLGEEQ